MANIDLLKADRIEIVESIIQFTAPSAEAITAGMVVRIDKTTGKFTKSNATTDAEARAYGIATRTVPAGMPVTAVRQGVLAGYDLDDLDYDDDVFISDTDGRLADTAGTVEKVLGRVFPGFANTIGTSPAKLLMVEVGRQGPQGEQGEPGGGG